MTIRERNFWIGWNWGVRLLYPPMAIYCHGIGAPLVGDIAVVFAVLAWTIRP